MQNTINTMQKKNNHWETKYNIDITDSHQLNSVLPKKKDFHTTSSHMNNPHPPNQDNTPRKHKRIHRQTKPNTIHKKINHRKTKINFAITDSHLLNILSHLKNNHDANLNNTIRQYKIKSMHNKLNPIINTMHNKINPRKNLFS